MLINGKCGTLAGYMVHRKRKEDFCESCRNANIKYLLDWRRKKGQLIENGLSTKRLSLPERFNSMLVSLPNGCKIWTGYKGPGGYGRITGNGGSLPTHRLAWELSFGKIPKGLCVCHSCDNRICCNIDHLWLGTIAENNADRSAKGRTYKPLKTHCKYGHTLAGTNIFMSAQGRRRCRTCYKITMDRNNAKRVKSVAA
jgi:rhodanese-related sulfurtransferase